MITKIKAFFSIENRTKYFIHLIVFLSMAAIAVFGLLIIGENALNRKNDSNTISTKINPFDTVELEAKSAMVWDVVNNRELFSKNPDLPLPLASLTKVMTAVTAQSITPDAANVKIVGEHLLPEGDSGLLVGDSWRASDLRDFTLLTSSNDGAAALAAFAESKSPEIYNQEDARTKFINSMNKLAVDIGLSNSRFFNEHGLDKNTEMGGAYGSAQDMALLFEYALQNHFEIMEATRYKSLQFASNEKVYSAENTNIFVDKIPNLIASKTGYTDLAGGNLVIAYDAGLNRPIIISVLGSSQEGRFTDALKLVEASMEYLQKD